VPPPVGGSIARKPLSISFGDRCRQDYGVVPYAVAGAGPTMSWPRTPKPDSLILTCAGRSQRDARATLVKFSPLTGSHLHHPVPNTPSGNLCRGPLDWHEVVTEGHPDKMADPRSPMPITTPS
jgi:hypothetical protein